MLAWVVIDRRHHRLADPFALLPCTPSIPSRHLSPLLSTSYRHSCTTAAPQPLYNQSVTHSFHHDGGVYSPAALRISSLITPHCIQVLSFQILAHSFAILC